MNNDLISRSVLTKELRERLVACNEWEEKAKDNETRIRANAVKTFLCEMFMLLKEIPTVEPEPVSEYQKRALAIVDTLTEKHLINVRERGCLRRSILLEPERPHIIDNCDMNVFEPEKHMKERPKEEKLYEIKVNVPDDVKERLIHDLQDPKFFDSRRIFAEEVKSTNDCVIAYGDGFESARRLYEKPHGEWIFNNKWQDYECNKCHDWTRKRQGELPNFCGNCGADMRKGEEE